MDSISAKFPIWYWYLSGLAVPGIFQKATRNSCNWCNFWVILCTYALLLRISKCRWIRVFGIIYLPQIDKCEVWFKILICLTVLQSILSEGLVICQFQSLYLCTIFQWSFVYIFSKKNKVFMKIKLAVVQTKYITSYSHQVRNGSLNTQYYILCL